MLSPRGSSWPRDIPDPGIWTSIGRQIGRRILYHLLHLGSRKIPDASGQLSPRTEPTETAHQRVCVCSKKDLMQPKINKYFCFKKEYLDTLIPSSGSRQVPLFWLLTSNAPIKIVDLVWHWCNVLKTQGKICTLNTEIPLSRSAAVSTDAGGQVRRVETAFWENCPVSDRLNRTDGSSLKLWWSSPGN